MSDKTEEAPLIPAIPISNLYPRQVITSDLEHGTETSFDDVPIGRTFTKCGMLMVKITELDAYAIVNMGSRSEAPKLTKIAGNMKVFIPETITIKHKI